MIAKPHPHGWGADGLTDRQREVLDFVRGYIARRGYAPTVREIVRHFGYASNEAAHHILRTLGRKGSLRREPGCARALVPAPFDPDGILSPHPAGASVAIDGVRYAGPISRDPEGGHWIIDATEQG